MESNLSAQDITKVANFISSVNNLINGKFILADVKIAEVLKKIESSPALFKFVSESLIGFNFDKELRKAEIKNRFNGGVFKLPAGKKEATALSFCLLVEFDAKRIDYYGFVKENFPTLDNKGNQKEFANTILVPFRDAIAKEFGLSKENNEDIMKDLKGHIELEKKEEKEAIEKEKVVEKTKEDLLFENAERIQKHMLELIEQDKKIKPAQKEDMIFILDAMLYANKYKDLRILNALLVSFNFLVKKVQSIKFVYDELKQLIIDYYD